MRYFFFYFFFVVVGTAGVGFRQRNEKQIRSLSRFYRQCFRFCGIDIANTRTHLHFKVNFGVIYIDCDRFCYGRCPFGIVGAIGFGSFYQIDCSLFIFDITNAYFLSSVISFLVRCQIFHHSCCAVLSSLHFTRCLCQNWHYVTNFN